jgi:hypothetical protein
MNAIAAVTDVPSRRRDTAAKPSRASASAGTAHSTGGAYFLGTATISTRREGSRDSRPFTDAETVSTTRRSGSTLST